LGSALPGGKEALDAYEAGLGTVRKCRDIAELAKKRDMDVRLVEFSLGWVWFFADEFPPGIPFSELGEHFVELVRFAKPHATYEAICSIIACAMGGGAFSEEHQAVVRDIDAGLAPREVWESHRRRSKKGTLPEGG
jgi:hypothetical protein